MKNVQMVPFIEKRFAREAQFKRVSIFKRMKLKNTSSMGDRSNFTLPHSKKLNT
jgi:hypothetical protein